MRHKTTERAPIRVVVTTNTQSEHEPGFVRQQLLDALALTGLEPVVIHAGLTDEVITAAINTAKGIIIPGGTDVHPRFYDQPKHPNTTPEDERRDELELRILEISKVQGIPLLGICRGAQVIWIAHGGLLIQHLPYVSSEVHGKTNPTYADLYEPGFHHKVKIQPNSKSAHFLQMNIQDSFMLPSMHHQAAEPGTAFGLTVDGVSPAGVVELFSSDTHPFMVGVQGHPEAWSQSHDSTQQLTGLAFFWALKEAIELSS